MATRCCSFETVGRAGAARTGVLHLPHGDVPTPAFMPVGTRGVVRGISSHELVETGASIVLANTYHLWVRPGHELIRDLGGLHTLMGWSGPILTDSGGYQVFSMRDRLKVTEKGARVRSPEDGEYRLLTPEKAVEIQEALGVDVAMAFDECLEWPADRDRIIASTNRTTRWLHRCLAARRHADRTALFGIVQGGMDPDLRAAHAAELAALDLDGYAIGGLSVGEGKGDMHAMTEAAVAELPDDRVRYLMGVGHPVDLVDAIMRGVDLFDCVIPTRAGRHGQLYTWEGRRNFRNARYATDPGPVIDGVDHPLATLSRAYVRHLIKSDEALGKRVLTFLNLHFYQDLLARVRARIAAGDTAGLKALREAARVATAPVEDGV